jgi:penicillin-binding protein 2
MDAESPRLRLSILAVVVFSLFAVMFMRLWYLQIMAPDQGDVEANANSVRVIQEEAPRGRILDDKGRILVDNRTSLVVTVDRNIVGKLKPADRADEELRLATQLTDSGVPTKVADIDHRLGDPQYNPLTPVPVAMDVSDDMMVYLAERSDEYPGVTVQRETVREYPNGSVAAHVLGYVGAISDTEYTAKMGTADDPKKPAKPYEPDSQIGKAGVEATFEDELRGTPGERTVNVDAQGKVISTISERKPVPGDDIVLTIDLDLQKSTEQHLADQLIAERGKLTSDHALPPAEGKSGSAVVIDPKSGDVKAMASYPTYDPTEFVNGIASDTYRKLSGNGDPDDNALINRAIAGTYSPGSTFKLVSSTAALEKGIISPGQYFTDTGSYQVGRDQVRHNAEGSSYGPVNVTQALTYSVDTFFYMVGKVFWDRRAQVGDGLQDEARAYGFGARTGIQLPGEASGTIPDAAWKAQLVKALGGQGDANWEPGDSASLAVGQGDLLVTPLQLANAYATFAAHGVRHQPNLVHEVLSTGTDPTSPGLAPCAPDADLATAHCIVRVLAPVVTGNVTYDDTTYNDIHAGLDGVTKNPRGTATSVFQGFNQAAFPILGKTGTVEVANNRKANNSVFVGVGPEQDPQYVALAYLEYSGFGVEAAAPVVRHIFDTIVGADQNPCPTAPPGGPTTTTTTIPGTPPCPAAPGAATTAGTAGAVGTTATTPTTTRSGAAPNTTVRPTTPTTSRQAVTPTTRPQVTPTTPSAPPTTPPPTTAAVPTTEPPPTKQGA